MSVLSQYFFLQASEMKIFRSKEISDQLSLDREKLIALALLVGSDYTDGAHNIGPEKALKLIGRDGPLEADVLNR